MDHIFMLDYLGMLYLRAGYFESGYAAEEWIETNRPHQKHRYTVVEIAPGKREGLTEMHYNHRYAHQS